MAGRDTGQGQADGCITCVRGDDSFRHQMRFHQSWYRQQVLGLEAGSTRGRRYGNLLTAEDGLKLRNFITASIREVVRARTKSSTQGIQMDRLRRNLLSSQPMCFNLFGPLAADHELATTLTRSLAGSPEDLSVTGVAFEFAPDPKKHLDDGTAFDAFVEYTRPSRRRGFVGIETKFTEPFSQKAYEFGQGYSRWKSEPGWWWRKCAEKDFPNTLINQLWRNHLLAFAVLHQSRSTYEEAYCAVVSPEQDASCREALKEYRTHLEPEGNVTLLEWPLHQVVRAWERQSLSEEARSWLNEFRVRYLDLEASKAAWELHVR